MAYISFHENVQTKQEANVIRVFQGGGPQKGSRNYQKATKKHWNLLKKNLKSREEIASSPPPPIRERLWFKIGFFFRDESIRGFYKGLPPSLLRVVPATAITFSVYEHAHHFLADFRKPIKTAAAVAPT